MTESPDIAERKMRDAIEYLRQELKGIRTNRASPALVDTVQVEVYGSKFKLRELAQISVSDSRQILITPFDPKNAGAIGKAITKANLNLNPVVDATTIRVNIPPMDEATRKDMGRLCRTKGEEAKISIRNARRESLEISKHGKAEVHLSEDECKREEKKIQEFTNKYCKIADDLCHEREREVLVV